MLSVRIAFQSSFMLKSINNFSDELRFFDERCHRSFTSIKFKYQELENIRKSRNNTTEFSATEHIVLKDNVNGNY